MGFLVLTINRPMKKLFWGFRVRWIRIRRKKQHFHYWNTVKTVVPATVRSGFGRFFEFLWYLGVWKVLYRVFEGFEFESGVKNMSFQIGPPKTLFIRQFIIEIEKTVKNRTSRLLVLPFSPCSNNENVVFTPDSDSAYSKTPKKLFHGPVYR